MKSSHKVFSVVYVSSHNLIFPHKYVLWKGVVDGTMLNKGSPGEQPRCRETEHASDKELKFCILFGGGVQGALAGRMPPYFSISQKMLLSISECHYAGDVGSFFSFFFFHSMSKVEGRL